MTEERDEEPTTAPVSRYTGTPAIELAAVAT